MKRNKVTLSSLALVIAAGCAGPGGEGESPPGSAAAEHRAAVAWGPCPEESLYAWYPDAECATIPMPLDHRDPSAGTFGYFVARKRSGAPHAPALWLIDGGPGSSGEDFFYGLVDEFNAAIPEADLYIPAHRGTGRSAGLVCSGEAWGTPRDTELSPEEWQSCAAEVTAQWGDKLALFNMTQAADDIGDAVTRLREPGQEVFVYGLSYGTTLAIRYLHHHPHQADGVILDSIATPGRVFQSQADTYFDDPLRGLGELCMEDALCASKMGPDPAARIGDVFAALDAGHCAEAGIDRALLRQITAVSLMGWSARVFALAVPYRLERCAPEDVAALQTFVPFWISAYDLDGFSHALEANISFNEFWESPAPSGAMLTARAEGALASLDWAVERRDVYDFWPKYTPEIEPSAWPRSSVPMLMMNGSLDGMTPLALAQETAAHFDGPAQTFVTIPGAPHGAGYQSPTTLPDGLPCGLSIMASFMAHPHAPPDTSCTQAMAPIPFERPAIAALVFGTGSVWENIPPASSTPAAAPPPAEQRMMARARRR